MNTANNIFKKVINFSSREKALDFCRNHPEFNFEDQTEGVNDNYTTIFNFKDDSILRIDSENFVYCDEHESMTFVNKWEQ